jgi:4-hydroxy-tetrahydrodipicolinate synthase
MKRKIGGVIIAPLLPFDQEGQIQEDALAEHVDFLINAGAHALYCLGSMGEFPSMSIAERKKAAEMIVDEVAKRVPVAIHVGTTALRETIELARHSEDIGADAVYCVPPYYCILDDAAILHYYEEIAASISIPLHIYNIPRLSKVNISPQLMIRLARIQNVTAAKDSAGDLAQTQQFIELTDLDIFIGTEALYLPGLVSGAAGCVSGVVGPVFPELLIRFYDAFNKRDFERARGIQRKINALTKAITESGNTIPAVKEAIRLRGYRMGETLSPLRPLTQHEVQVLEISLKKLAAI